MAVESRPNVAASALFVNCAVHTATATVADDARHIVYNGTSTATLTLPAPGVNGIVLFVEHAGTATGSTLTLVGASSTTFGGTTAFSLPPNGRAMLLSVGSTQYDVFPITSDLQVLTASGAITPRPFGRVNVLLLGTAAIAATLTAPSAGDTVQYNVRSASAHQHTLTLSATRINGATLGTVTFGGAQGTVGLTIDLQAYNGTLYGAGTAIAIA